MMPINNKSMLRMRFEQKGDTDSLSPQNFRIFGLRYSFSSSIDILIYIYFLKVQLIKFILSVVSF